MSIDRACTPPPAWGWGERGKNFKKVFAGGGGQKFLFWWGGGLYCWGGGAGGMGARN